MSPDDVDHEMMWEAFLSPIDLTPEERYWLNKMSHDAQPLQLGIMGRRGEFTPIIEDLEAHEAYKSPEASDYIMGKVYTHVREVQAMEAEEVRNEGS